MEALVDAGKCKSIGGVSNYPLLLMHDLVTQARIQPACNQIEVHAYYKRESLVNYCLSRGICISAHTPLGGGLLNKEINGNAEIPLEDATIQTIAASHNKSAAQVLLRWLLQRGIVVLPKSMKPARMKENFSGVLSDDSFVLSDQQMADISALDKYRSYKTNPNPLPAFIGGPDFFPRKEQTFSINTPQQARANKLTESLL
mmetsp:Transcript_18498/g.23821  ORF Transcript_18498/g.23821 Transcript_18498/m.23821 type:complete len:201 (-) Transcript_18498:213-815(-)|eukprot:CAMPEP_0198141442 /NCGR_PEP_ID=MMETSP1443-20131203/4451_1 /TAXON_ID=186043 /ORGANISM="Entomoneis sp., Strain CCMP2396" /LENGTH=200 /DNA_ID=CAMNT_0043804193 /DNA_START=114 /DNA_END=716 /DNA_ORIENTATION=-